MLNLNRANRNAIATIFVLIAIIFVLSMFKNTSAYEPRPITIKVVNEKSIFDLEHRLECAPGHTKDGSTYTMSLTPGGLCGSEELVSQQAGYAIEEGIGGSLI